MSVFVFDIETVPDTAFGRRYYQVPDLSDADVASLMMAKRQAQSGTDFLKHPFHQIVAISVVFEDKNQVKVWSLGSEDASEAELIQRFFQGVEKYSPTLVSWNGSGFDLPVLHYRALHHRIAAPRYWEVGEQDMQFKWNNYINRYHYRHMDLMDVLSSYQSKACASLEEVAMLLGFPGKLGMHGSKVWEAYQTKDLAGIRNYCETDVLNTYLVYLEVQHMRGLISPASREEKMNTLANYLKTENKAHFSEFLSAWK